MTDTADKETKKQICSAVVKSVTSGNRMIVRQCNYKPGTIPNERVVVLSFVTCPQPGKMVMDPSTKIRSTTEDNVFAYEVKEFTRKMVIGKTIKFSIEYQWSNINQVAGNVWLANENPDTDDGLIEKGLANGMFTLNEKSQNISDKLRDLNIGAKNLSKGIYDISTIHEARKLVFEPEVSEKIALFKKLEKKELDCQVEAVLTGSTIKIYLPSEQTFLVIVLTGVRCNSASSTDKSYAAEAKFFVEDKLLNRDLKVILEHCDTLDEPVPGRITGTLLHPRGNVSEILLTEGLAQCADWSMKYYTGKVEKLRACQNEAKKNKKRLQKNYKAPAEKLGTAQTFNGIVKQIVQTDSIIVRKTDDHTELKISLSSCRPIRVKDFDKTSWEGKIKKLEESKRANREIFNPSNDLPVNWEAKEFLRKKLIGQKVKICIDYKQDSREDPITKVVYPERLCATVQLGDTNVAEVMLGKGYLKTIQHGSSDDNRSIHYDTLQQAEQRASQTKQGIYNISKLSLPKILELSGKDRTTPFFTQYQRQSSVLATVDHVFSASRLKCYIPKDNVNVMVIVAGIEAPKVGLMKNGVRTTPSEPLGEEASKFTWDRVMQRDVSLNVVGQDKWGAFVAYVTDPKSNNLSISLCQEGLAKVHWSAERHTSYYGNLLAAQDKAKTSKKNLWKGYVEEEATIVEDSSNSTTTKVATAKAPVTVLISDIRYPIEGETNILVSVQGNKAETTINTIQSNLSTEMKENPPMATFKPRRNEIIAAKWPIDEEWYRAKVEKVVDKTIFVSFVDFGNQDNFVYQGRIAKIPATIDLSAFSAQSKLVKLALVEYPSSEDTKDVIFEYLCAGLLNCEVDMVSLYTYNQVEHVRFLDNKEDKLHNLIEEGKLVVAEKKRNESAFSDIHKVYMEKQAEALSNHCNLWKYGDFRGYKD